MRRRVSLSSNEEPAPLGGQWVTLDGNDRALWHPTTGRGLRVHPQTPLTSPPPAFMARLRDLGFIDLDVGKRFAARSRWTVLLPDTGELWHACPLERGPGGLPYRSMPIDPVSIELWRACDGRHSLTQIAEQLGLSLESVTQRMAPWTQASVQALQLRSSPIRNREPGLAHLLTRERPAHARKDHHYADGATTLDSYHQDQITQADHHFDDREITFAHSFERPHPALNNQTFGQALAQGLQLRNLPLTGHILEIGPGTGALSEAFTAAVSPKRYTRLDLAPALLEAQKRRSPETVSLLGSATEVPLADNSVDLVLSNEVIADLRAAPTVEGWLVPPAAGQTLFNTGAWAMLREVARVLRPGGWGYISEFGAIDELPQETTHLDHPEVSIHFGQLRDVALSLGLEAELVPVGTLLHVNRDAHWLSRPSTEALRALYHRHGSRLTAHARTPAQLSLPWVVEGLWWVPITEPGGAPILDRLWALLVHKPH